MNTTETWRRLLRDVLESGKPVEQNSAGAAFRGRTSYELISHRTVWPMSNSIVLCPARKPGFRYLAAEAAWILSGSNRLADIAPYAKHMVNFSDDGEFLAGAYGPPWRDQLPYVVQTLTRDRFSRQAVVTCWRPRPGASKDVPCTISLQHLIRDEPVPTLHTVVMMRSNDVFFGTVYDVHTFSMISAYVALLLRDHLGPLTLGLLYLSAGSQHLYKLDREAAEACAIRDDELFDGVKPIDLTDFSKPDELIQHLWVVARREGVTHGSYLKETMR